MHKKKGTFCVDTAVVDIMFKISATTRKPIAPFCPYSAASFKTAKGDRKRVKLGAASFQLRVSTRNTSHKHGQHDQFGFTQLHCEIKLKGYFTDFTHKSH